MRGGIVRVRAYCHFERGARLVVLALRGVEHGQVVVGLRQLGKILRQLGEDRDRVVGLVLVGKDHPLEEAPARVLGLSLEVGIDAVERSVELFLLEKLIGFLQAIALR